MSPRERLFALEQFGIKLGLETIATLLEALDRPERAYRSVHIAGTNGKGSVSAMVERGLRAAGHRTGRYTSPHLTDIEERIAVDGEPVSAALFDAVTADVLRVVDRLQTQRTLTVVPTFFEVTTAIAFELFRREGVQAAVVEVGLGGRFDATNVVMPAVTAITSIAFDHERHLGSTLDAIAFEKAGIIKTATPVVVGELPPEAEAVVLRQALSCGAPVIAARRAAATVTQWQRGRATIHVRTQAGAAIDARLALNGAHQVDNAVVAVRMLEACAARGIAMTASDIVTGLSQCEWPGRLEWLRLSSGAVVLIDAAHNPAGASALADYLSASGAAPITLVTAIMQDKDAGAMLRSLAPVVGAVVATSTGTERSHTPESLAALARTQMDVSVVQAADARAALDQALALERPVCIAGSIFLAGPLRAQLIAGGAVPVDGPA